MKYIVRKGDYLAKIAAVTGYSAHDVWNDPANAELRSKRDPNVLAPGDLLTLPDAPPEPAPLSLHGENAFVADLPSVDVVLALEQDGKRLSNEPYLVEGLASQVMQTTDSDGVARFTVDVSVARVALLVPKRGLRFDVRVGYLHPASVTSGLRARLCNLAYHADSSARLLEDLLPGPLARTNQESDSRLVAAISAFQKAASLPVSGRADKATISALVRAHGS